MNKKQLTVILLVFVFLLNGCAHRRAKRKAPPSKPYEAPAEFNFKGTPKNDAKFFQTLGLDLYQAGDWPEADFYLKKAVKLDPTLYLSWYCLGLLNIETRQGYNYLKKSVAIKPDFPFPYYWMAYYMCRNRQDKRAIPLFQKYLELVRGNANESDRIMAANEVLQDLLSGREGEILKMMRKPAIDSYENIK